MNGIEHNQEAASGMVPHAAQAHQGDMQNKPTDENPTTKETTDPWDNFDAQQAFLGPNLWDKRLPYDGSDFKVGECSGLFPPLLNCGKFACNIDSVADSYQNPDCMTLLEWNLA